MMSLSFYYSSYIYWQLRSMMWACTIALTNLFVLEVAEYNYNCNAAAVTVCYIYISF